MYIIGSYAVAIILGGTFLIVVGLCYKQLLGPALMVAAVPFVLCGIGITLIQEKRPTDLLAQGGNVSQFILPLRHATLLPYILLGMSLMLIAIGFSVWMHQPAERRSDR